MSLIHRPNDFSGSLECAWIQWAPHQCREIFPAAIRLTDSNSCLEHEDKICQLGRIYPSSHCPAAYYNGLYKKCIGSHGEACEERKNLAVKGQRHFGRFPIVMPEHTAFRVIDVNRACIVEVPNNCRYVALSYVWGSSEFLHLTKHNQQKLYRHGDLLRECIPRTIRDATGVMLELEESYLWVDALCIVQDDEHDISAQIKNIHKIFSNAAVTIIAASGRVSALASLDSGRIPEM